MTTSSTAGHRIGRLPVGLVLACHPGPALAVTVLTTALAVVAGRGPAGSALVAAAIGTGQLSIGWCNDTVDRDRDRASGRADKPVATGAVPARATGTAAALALAASVPLSFANGWRAGAVHLVAVASGWAYDLGLKRTPASWLPYAVSFGSLPAFVTLGLPGHPVAPLWATAGAAMLGVGAHLANVLPDIDDDRATGVLGLPQRLGPRWTRLLAVGFLVAATAVLAAAPHGRPDAPGWVGLAAAGVVAAVALPGPHRARWALAGAIGVAAVDVLLLVARGSALA